MATDDLVLKLARILREAPEWVDELARLVKPHDGGAPKPPTGLEKHRAQRVETVLGELKLMFEADATTGSKIDQWLLDHPGSLVQKAREQDRREVDVMLSRVDAGHNIGEGIEIVGILENVTAQSIKVARTAVRRAHKMKSKNTSKRT